MQQKLHEMAANRVHTAPEDWKELVSEIWEMENTQAASWRKFSRLRWIREGEAPSKFFLSILKARRAQEEISSLVKDDGMRLEDDESILEELKHYYQELYRQLPVSAEDEELRQCILKLVHKRLTVALNSCLTEEPTEEEIGKVILSLKREKVPGLDGMTVEVLRLLWRHTPGDVIGEGRPILYLGYPIGWKVPESQLLNFITGKLERKLGNWAYRLLTFEGRLIVLKHIVRSIPVHLLSCMALDPQTLKKMEQTCRRFVWGRCAKAKADSEDGAPPGRRLDAGSGGSTEVDDSEETMGSMRDWEVEEILMTKCPGSISGAKTATGLLKVWTKAKTKLELQRNEFTP
ncbi:hypothetical protein R1flu_004207 [Riccia fluitans]|uniref:Reverse transcriptase n=1 Tax=Riccia fluitans TaxID=41844 RepID=A0ABD1YPX3_9MARC